MANGVVKLAVHEEQLKEINTKLDCISKQLEEIRDYPVVRRIVYGMVGFILLSFLTGVAAVIWRS